MNALAKLQQELAQARAEIKYLREAMTPPPDFRIPGKRGLTRYQHILLYALATTKGCLTETQICARLDIGRPSGDLCDVSLARCTIFRLRRTLQRQKPPIIVRNIRGLGYYLDDSNKELVLKYYRTP